MAILNNQPFINTGLFDDINKTNNQISSMNIPQAPQAPQVPQIDPMIKRQRYGNMMLALSDVLRGKDPSQGVLQRQQMIAQQQAQAKQQKLIEDYKLKNPEMADRLDAIMAGIPESMLGGGERKIVKGADGYNYYADTGKRVLPGVEKEDSKEYKSVKDAAGYLRYTEGPQKGERVFPEVVVEKRPDIKDEASLRKEFNEQSKYFKGIGQSFGKVLGTDPTAAGDVSLIFAYMKMLDPGSVVREGEQATAAQAAGVPSRVINLYNRVLTGEKLTPDQRADFRKQAQNIYDLALSDQSEIVSRYTSIAKDKGMKPETIIFDYTKGIQPLIFRKSLEDATLEDLQQLDASKYNKEELEILAKVLADKIRQGS